MIGVNPFSGIEPETWRPDALLADPRAHVITDEVTLAPGDGELPRGAVLGIVAETGLAVLAAPGAVDGSAQPVAVLVAKVTLGATPTKAWGYFSGEFNGEYLTLAEGWTPRALADAMRRAGLHVRMNAAAWAG